MCLPFQLPGGKYPIFQPIYAFENLRPLLIVIISDVVIGVTWKSGVRYRRKNLQIRMRVEVTVVQNAANDSCCI